MNEIETRPFASGKAELGAPSQPVRASVLMVDDQPARLLSYEAVLAGLGVHCVRALSGAAALAALLKEEFAVVLLDVQMPEMDGFEVARLIRAHPRYEQTPIIFVTGVHVSELDQLKGYQAGAIDYIAVPVVPEILRSKVAVLVELYQRRRELARVNQALETARDQLAHQHAKALAGAESALRENERRFQALLENAPVAVAHNSPDGRFEYVNKGFCELVGYSAEELLGMTWQQITHPEDLALDQELGQKVIAGEMPDYTMQKRYLRKDGRAIWVNLFGNFVRNDAGEILQGVAVAVDITAQRSAEAKLRDSEQQFRELANNIDQLAWTCNELGHGEWYNDRWYDYTGLTFETSVGTGWTQVQHPAHLERVTASIRQCMRSGEPWEDSFPLRGKDGQYRWFLSRATPIRDASGRIVRWFGTNTDVTELRRLEEALKESARRKDEFLAMLSHELRNPIAPIRNAAEVLARLAAPDERQLAMVGIVQRQAQHLSRLLDDLLEVARITQGRIELRREILPLNECIQLAIETVEPLIRRKGHELSVRQAVGPVYLNVDRARLVLCVANVLTNAAKYTPSAGRIGIRSHVGSDSAIIEVTDNGIGISAELLPRIFDLFVQGERSLDRSEGGLGIGLSVCKQLIEMHDGTITARSDGDGCGATFVITLPLAGEPANVSASTVSNTRTLRVLIVDDNQDAADSLALMLQIEGHETCTAYSAEAGIDEVVAFSPDVVLLDIGLPRMDGYEVARRMRQFVPMARLIALTGYGQAEDRRRAQDAGFDAHLLKPVELTALAKLLDPVRA